MTLKPGIRLGPYEVLAPLGTGGMGEVYRARDTRLDRTVAIKILSTSIPGANRRRAYFEREARALSQLTHPRICALYDIGHDNGTDFAVMECLEGQTLADRLAARPMRLEQALHHALEILEALDAAHRRGLVHGDLKPGNIMLTTAGAKLLDFGLARWLGGSIAVVPEPARVSQGISAQGRDRLDRTVTLDGALIGTPHYMAPEQLDGRSVDVRADIFAFGAVLYEMIARRKAFNGASVDDVITRITEDDPSPISAALEDPSPALERVIDRCLAKDPDDRWQTARDLASEVRWILQAPVPSERVTGSRSRIARIAWWTAALFLIAVPGLVFGLRPYVLSSSASPVLRFVVMAPEGTTLSPSASLLALSPDGRAIAFLASHPGAATRIWVRQLDSLGARELAGTDGALGPFWSPDSSEIAFFADGKLKKVGLLGQAPVVIGDAPVDAPTGAWNRDGVILVSLPSGIHRISASGGTSTPVTIQQDGTSRLLPQFLPDGRHFIFLARTDPQIGDSWVILGSLDSPQEQRLFSAESQALYAAGHMFFLRNGRLMAQPFDAGRLRLAGPEAAVPEADRVAFNPGNTRAMFSVSESGTLAYRTAVGREIAWYDRTGRSVGSVSVTGLDQEPVISRDGRHLAFSRIDPATSTRSIWTLDLTSGGLATRLTSTASASPLWSPTGTFVMFSCGPRGNVKICQKQLDGSVEERVVAERPAGSPQDWSLDGRYLVYSRGRFGGLGTATNSTVLWLLPFHPTSPPVQLTDQDTTFSEWKAQISPDSRWIAYTSDVSGANEIYVRPFPHGGRNWKVSSSGGIEPRWRRDGRELFYIRVDGTLMAAPVTTDSSFRSGTPQALFPTRMETTGRLGIIGRNQYDVNADGQRFIINQPPLNASPSPITVVVNWRPTGGSQN